MTGYAFQLVCKVLGTIHTNNKSDEVRAHHHQSVDDPANCTKVATIEYGSDDEDRENDISLHAIAEEGSIDTLKSLLERGVDINVRDSDADNDTPLFSATAWETLMSRACS